MAFLSPCSTYSESVPEPPDPPVPGSAGRLLIVAGAEAASADALPPAVRELIEHASEVLVVAPVLTSKLHLWTNQTDRAREQADERLAAILSDIDAIHPKAGTRGVVGDDVPMQAFDDAVRLFQTDHILIGLRAGKDAGWQERQLVDHVREEFQLPVTVIEIDERGQVSPTRRRMGPNDAS